MTVAGLSSILKKYSVPMLGRAKKTNSTIPAYMNQLSKRTLTVDTSMLIYKVNSLTIDKAADRWNFKKDSNGKWDRPPEELVHKLFIPVMKEYVNGLVKTGVRLIFVIEGRTPRMKEATSEKRHRERVERSLVEHEDYDRHIKSLKDKYLLSNFHTEATISILKETKCRILQAEFESEGVCAHLVAIGKAHGVLAEDGDLVMLGCPIMIRKLRALNLDTGHFEYQGLALIDVLINIGFLNVQYSDDGKPIFSQEDYKIACDRVKVLCILSGTDYHDGVYRMGIIKIHNLMMENNCYTYDDVCKIDPRFLAVPYEEIIQTLEENKKYTLIR